MDDRNDVGRDDTEASSAMTRPRHAGGGAEDGAGKRFSAKRKLLAAQWLLQGESLDAVSCDLQVPARWLLERRDRVLIAAEGALKERERDARDAEIERLTVKVCALPMDAELLNAKIDRLQTGRPFAG